MSYKRIMIIEKNLSKIENLEYSLSKKEYDIIAVESNGDKAIKKLEKIKPDIILINFGLDGDINGIETVRIINRKYDIPIIYIVDEDKNNIQLIKTTRYCYVLKYPFSECELYTAIEISLEKHLLEKKIRDSRGWLFTILRSIEDGIIVTDTKGFITFINTIAQKLVDMGEVDVIGKTYDEIYQIKNPGNLDKIENPVDEILRKGSYVEIGENLTFVSRKGKQSIVNLSGSPIQDNEGKLIGVVIVLHDITEKIRSQKALKESEALHRITLNSISDAVFITNNFGDFTYICPNAEVIFGYTDREIEKLGNISSILGSNLFHKAELEKSKEITNINRRILNKYNKHLDLLVNVKKVSIAGGTILYTCHDITELKKAQDKISRLNRMYFLLSEISEAIVRIHDSKKLFDEVCRIAVERGSFRLSWIGLTDNKTNEVIPVSHYGFEDGYLEKIKISVDENKSGGNNPTSIAIRTKQRIICNNVSDSNDMKIKTDELLKREFHSFATLPLWVGKKLLVFKCYANEKDFFNDEEIYLIDRLGEDISLAFTSIEYENYLRGDISINERVNIDKRIANKVRMSFLDTENQKGNINSNSKKNLFKTTSHHKVIPRISGDEYTIQDIITINNDFKEQLSYLPEIAESDLTTLVYGESGTGKELVAFAIKNLSQRKDKPFLVVNCAALPDNLLESELFGYMKGAFTGASNNKIGLFQAANGGTIFLDEIGDISPRMQVKILRTLQEKEIIPLGSVTKLKIDIRFICATNKNLHQLVKEEKFRQDLYYRLNVVTVDIPPLRKRKDDIPILVEHFINIYNKQWVKK